MKKNLVFMITILFLCSFYFLTKIYTKDNKLFIGDKTIRYNILTGGMKDAVDFAVSGEDIFIAFKNKIQVIEKNGKSYTLFHDKNADIKSIVYYKNCLYLINKSSFFSLELQETKVTELIKGIPNFGDYQECKLMVKEDRIYIAVGAATNSGIVGEDNTWKDTYPFNHDVSPKNIIISESINNKTGAFVPFNTKNIPGQKISAHYPGNASIIVYTPEKTESALYCWGVRNVKAMDFDSTGRIFAAIGGMEPRGERAVKGDVDYIYELKYDVWYGWPDFSGGDPLNSPRFKNSQDGRIPFLLQKHPSINPPAPYYQHKSLNTLTALAIDKLGVLGKKDCIYFYDNSDNILYNIDNKGVVARQATLDKNYSISTMKIVDSSVIMLEKNNGLLIQLGGNNVGSTDARVILIYVIGLIIVVCGIIAWKLKS